MVARVGDLVLDGSVRTQLADLRARARQLDKRSTETKENAMQIRAEEISQIIRKEIEGFDKKVAVTETGTVLEAGDGIARVYGLDGGDGRRAARLRHGGVVGLVLNLEEDNVGVALLGNFEEIREGDTSSAPARSRRSRWATR